MAVRLGDPVEKSFGRDDINDRYHRYDKILGRGAYKTVYWGWDTSDGVDVAWNCIDLDALPSTEERRKISREVEMLQQLNHRHILRIRDHWENPATNQLCFITDILQGGSLREYIRQREVNLLRCKSWCIQILNALHYLHSSSPVIIHRDLKCDNIFIDGPSGNITIGDLGLSTQYGKSTNLLSSSNNEERGMSIVGTPEFMAPELYEEKYDEKVDIYAFGMCVIEMISKKYPYEECTNQIQVIRKVTEKKQPDILRKLHRYVRTFIELCIERDPTKRPSAIELLSHPFLTFMDDLKNKLPVSYFVITEDRIIQRYKLMEEAENKQNKLNQLSTIIESNANILNNKSSSPSPHNKNIINKQRKQQQMQMKKKKKKYVSGTSVSSEGGGKISVQLKIHIHDKESQKVKFQYDPNTEDISSVVREMVETLELDQTRESEIVNAIKTKLNNLDLDCNNKPVTVNAPVLPKGEITSIANTQTSPKYSQRAATQPPTNITLANNNIKQPYSEPPSANTHSMNTQSQSQTPFYDAQPQLQAQPVQHPHFPKIFSANGLNIQPQSVVMPITSILNHNNPLPISNTQSAPVTPGHSPHTEKNMTNKLKPIGAGYTSDTATEFVARVDYSNIQTDNISDTTQSQPQPQLVSDSLLDQIMALPRETIKARIKQFGGTVNDDDQTRILVTKLFKLLSENTTTNRRPSNSSVTNQTLPQSQPQTRPSNDIEVIESDIIVANIDSLENQSGALIIHHMTPNNSSGNIQHIGSHNNLQHLNANNLGNLNAVKSSYHSEVTSTAQSVHATPPKIDNVNVNVNVNNMKNKPLISSNITSVSPQNELVYQQRQISQESIKSNPSHHSLYSQESPKSSHHGQQSNVTLSPKSSTTHHRPSSMNSNSHTIPNNIIIPPQIIDDDDEDDDIDPTIELPKLRIRQKKLMKGKVCAEMERLKQRNDTQLGRDKTIDNIALELDVVEKQIKLLTDAAKTGVKISKNKKIISREYSYQSDKDTSTTHSATESNKKIKTKNTTHTTHASSRPNSVEPEPTYHSRTNSNESNSKLPQISPDKKILNKLTVIADTKVQTQTQPATELSISNNVSDIGTINNSHCNSGSGSFLIEAPNNNNNLTIEGENNAHISSPLVSGSKRNEFRHYVQQLPERLDLTEIGNAIGQMENSLNNVLFSTYQTAENRIVREKKQLEEEYNQYYADQTEMLLLKLQKHKHNPSKCMSETQSTTNKLKYKQDKQRNKFKCIVNDQLQILQLTQELNENDDNIMNNNNNNNNNTPLNTSNSTMIADDEYYLYKDEMDKRYLERVKQFELKQKNELETFRNDLHQLKQLRLQVRKKAALHSSSTHSSPQHQSSQSHRKTPNQFKLQQNARNGNHNNKRNLHQHSSSSPAVQIDILTGLGDEQIMENDNNIPTNNQLFGNRAMHYHSSSLPLLDNKQTNSINNSSKFKVSEVGYSNNSHNHNLNHNIYPPQRNHNHNHYQIHAQSTANIHQQLTNNNQNNSSFDMNHNKNNNNNNLK